MLSLRIVFLAIWNSLPRCLADSVIDFCCS